MMNIDKKWQPLIQYLQKQTHPVKSLEIAKVLGVSVRTIKNYVSQINNTYNQKVILSSKNGYELNPYVSMGSEYFNKTNAIPQTNEERSYFIIKKLILNPTNKLDIFDICDDLALSYSSIKLLISKMNKNFASFDIQFSFRHDMLCLIGTEQAKRKLISYVLNEEMKDSFLNIHLLEEQFPNLEITSLIQIIRKNFQKHGYFLNDFSIFNMIIHLVIFIERIQSNNQIQSGHSKYTFKNNNEKAMMLSIRKAIENQFELTINQFEAYELYQILKANLSIAFNHTNEGIEKIVGKEIEQLSLELIDTIENKYSVDLSHSNFIKPFTLHLSQLIQRANAKKFNINPMTEGIKYNSPFIFDMAIQLALELKKRLNIVITEDEAAFLALHIGSEIEQQVLNEYKVTTILLCPDYYELSEKIANFLMIHFSNQVNLIQCVTHENELKKLNNSWQLLLTTIPFSETYSEKSILQISPFNLQKQLVNIQEAIEDATRIKRSLKLKEHFHRFFTDKHFLINTSITEKELLLENICSQLVDENYVDSSFISQILEREQAATTAFGNISIPHATSMNAIQTTIYVIINKNGIIWDKNIVYITFLMAINKADMHLFRNIYESLIDLFSDNDTMQKLIFCKDFEDFTQLINVKLSLA